MKYCYSILLVFTYSIVGAQVNPSNSFIVKHTYFAIAGKTNVNDFSCRLIRNDLSDTLHISGNWEGLNLEVGGLNFDLPVSEFDCGMKMMTRDFQKLLKYEEHPEVSLQINHLLLSDDYNLDSLESITSYTTIQITSEARKETIENGYFRKYEDQYILGGSHKIKMTDYHIEPPTRFLGTIRAQDELYIEFEIIFESAIVK